MQYRHHLLTLSKGGWGGGVYRKTPRTILWLGGLCSSVVVLTTSLISPRSSNHSDPKDRNMLCALGKNNPLMCL